MADLYCRHLSGHKLVVKLSSNGHKHLRKQCPECGECFGSALPQENVLNIDALPILPPDTTIICDHCGKPYAERHHYYLQSIAKKTGENADSWPTENLCEECHSKWHNDITPHLTGRWNRK